MGGAEACPRPIFPYTLLHLEDFVDARLLSLFEILPVGLAVGDHAPDPGDNQKNHGQAANQIPPLTIAHLLDPREEERINDGEDAAEQTEQNAHAQDGQRKDPMTLQVSWMSQRADGKIDKEKSSRDSPDQRGRRLTDIIDDN